ncbi:hypothetical protein [Streptomyces sp. NPDC015125]|uniref:hypothetical protein n=1 Tax=Streptomyces sp. NPDC015125 TaxID=3364938 RepID=UPI003701F6F1
MQTEERHGKMLLRPVFSGAEPSYRETSLKQFPADEVILVGEVVSESHPENDTDKKSSTDKKSRSTPRREIRTASSSTHRGHMPALLGEPDTAALSTC